MTSAEPQTQAATTPAAISADLASLIAEARAKHAHYRAVARRMADLAMLRRLVNRSLGEHLAEEVLRLGYACVTTAGCVPGEHPTALLTIGKHTIYGRQTGVDLVEWWDRNDTAVARTGPQPYPPFVTSALLPQHENAERFLVWLGDLIGA